MEWININNSTNQPDNPANICRVRAYDEQVEVPCDQVAVTYNQVRPGNLPKVCTPVKEETTHSKASGGESSPQSADKEFVVTRIRSKVTREQLGLHSNTVLSRGSEQSYTFALKRRWSNSPSLLKDRRNTSNSTPEHVVREDPGVVTPPISSGHQVPPHTREGAPNFSNHTNELHLNYESVV